MEDNNIKVWDVTTRIFHILLIVCVSGVFITSLRENLLLYHVWFGQATLTLVIFRIGWGWFGNRFARFSEFLVSPLTAVKHIGRLILGEKQHFVGHNPLAGWVMMILLTFLLSISISGLITLGGEERIGYLSRLFSFQEGLIARDTHIFLSLLLLVVIGLHIAGILLHIALHKENIIVSMITGKKKSKGDQIVSSSYKSFNWPLKITFTGLLAILFISYPYIIPTTYTSPLTLEAMSSTNNPEVKLYRQECGACHFAFHPSLLPARSWEKMMSQLEDHFGEDASLPLKEILILSEYMVRNSAEQLDSEASYKVLSSIPENQTPLRITESSYWELKHKKIDRRVYKIQSVKSPLNCQACHIRSEYGSYEDADIKVPEV